MRILKFFLYFILIICISWGVLIFAGPKLLEFYLKQKFAGQVNISGLEISPQLEIYASRVDLENFRIGDYSKVTGYVRSISIGWGGLFEGSPFLSFTTGPSDIDGLLSFDKKSGLIGFPNKFDFSAITITLNSQNLHISDFGNIVSANVSLMYNLYSNTISEITFDAENLFVKTGTGIQASSFTGSIDQLRFEDEFSSQPFLFEVMFNNLSLYDKQIIFNDFAVASSGSFSLLEVNFISAGGLLPDGLSFGNVSADLSLSESRQNGKLNFKLQDLNVPSGASDVLSGVIKNLDGSAQIETLENFKLELTGQMGQIEVINKGQFIADLSNSSFFINTSIESNSRLQSTFSLTTTSIPKILATGKALVLLETKIFSDCILQKCSVLDAKITYDLSVNSATLLGKSNCPNGRCADIAAEHTLSTDDTDLFFSEVIESRIFSPLLVATLYSQLKSANKEGKGHKINF